jgi:SAM-dependent methyltransferase
MKEWFRDWFSSEEYLHVYQHRDDNDAKNLLDLILANVNPEKNALILDAACGAGRHLLTLASLGYRVVGFDLSLTLLKKAAEEGRSRSLKFSLFCSDIRNVGLKSGFDVVLNLFTSFGYFDNDIENFKFIGTAFSFLKPGGLYILDFMNIAYLRDNLLPESLRQIGSKTILEKRRIEDQRVIKEIFIKENGAENKFRESVRLYSRETIIGAFEKEGFHLLKIFGNYEGSGFDLLNSPRLILFFGK